MQTIYYAASHIVHHEDNLVDLDKFRRKLAQSQKQPIPSHTEDTDRSDFQPPITICPAASRTRPDHFNRIGSGYLRQCRGNHDDPVICLYALYITPAFDHNML